MISLIKGEVVSLLPERVTVLTAGGVGYDLIINQNTAEKLRVGEEVVINSYLSVKENGMDLFGFLSTAERALFLKLLSVNGVGPKSALNILALGKTDDIIRAIANKDAAFLSEAHGIGKKAAERIVVDLSGKLGETAVMIEAGSSENKNILSDVIEGLVALGYSRVQALDVAKQLDVEGKSSEELLREALKNVK